MQDYAHCFSRVREAQRYVAFMRKHFLLARIANANRGEYIVVIMCTNRPDWPEKIKWLTDKFLSAERITGE